MVEVVDEPSLRNRIHVFRDRRHAGELLAEWLKGYRKRRDACILAIPAGGVQVAVVVAEKLDLPLDLVVTRKLHVPWNREAGFGAVSWDGSVFLNEPLAASLRLTADEIESSVEEEKEVIKSRLSLFRGDSPFPILKGKTAIVIDDGMASGFSMLATVKSLKQKGAMEVVVAVPTAPISAIDLVRSDADKIVCLNIRTGPIFAVADAYKVWYDLTDNDVMKILKREKISEPRKGAP